MLPHSPILALDDTELEFYFESAAKCAKTALNRNVTTATFSQLAHIVSEKYLPDTNTTKLVDTTLQKQQIIKQTKHPNYTKHCDKQKNYTKKSSTKRKHL